MYFCATIHALFEYKGLHVTYTVENVGGGIGQDPATEVTQINLQSFPVWWPAINYSMHAQWL